MTGLRLPAVAGKFYPGDPERLRQMISSFSAAGPRERAAAILVPHAGYEYSGRVAAATYARAAIPRDVVLLSFRHRGNGVPFGTWPRGAWRTPLGDAPIAEDLMERMRRSFPELIEDEAGFAGEHSGEVQVPFLQAARPDVRIAPVSLNVPQDRDGLELFGATLALVLSDELVVATTDLTHCGEGYGTALPEWRRPVDWAREQDRHVLDALERLDLPLFWDAVDIKRVAMCGVAPTAAFIAYARAKGATGADIVAYATSADDEPEADRAVGYPGVIVNHVEA
jgi:AmmeMemoRadiSam system protein B